MLRASSGGIREAAATLAHVVRRFPPWAANTDVAAVAAEASRIDEEEVADILRRASKDRVDALLRN